MRAGLPLLLNLLLAIATGVIPLRECRPTDGCGGGIVLAGSHGHDPDDHDTPGHEAPGHGDCVDTAMAIAAPASPVTLAAPAVAFAAPGLPTALPVAVALAAPAARGVGPDPGEVPPGVREVVLLR